MGNGVTPITRSNLLFNGTGLVFLTSLMNPNKTPVRTLQETLISITGIFATCQILGIANNKKKLTQTTLHTLATLCYIIAQNALDIKDLLFDSTETITSENASNETQSEASHVPLEIKIESIIRALGYQLASSRLLAGTIRTLAPIVHNYLMVFYPNTHHTIKFVDHSECPKLEERPRSSTGGSFNAIADEVETPKFFK